MANKNLFINDYIFYGVQNDQVKALCQKKIDTEDGVTIFSSGVELFIFAAMYGFIHKFKVPKIIDKSSGPGFKIFSDQLFKHNKSIELCFRTINLLDDSQNKSIEEKINNTFRDYEQNDNYTLFEEYMLGGVQLLYQKFFNEKNVRYENYLITLNEVISEIKESSLIEDVDDKFEEKLI